MGNKELIGQSLDMKYYKTQLTVLGVTVLLCMIPIMIVLIVTHAAAAIPPCILLYAIMFLPFLGYYLIRISELKRRPEQYALFDAFPDEMQSSFNRTMYFRLKVRNPNGVDFMAETKGIFTMNALGGLYFGDYFKHRLQILYDETDDRLIVVKKYD